MEGLSWLPPTPPPERPDQFQRMYICNIGTGNGDKPFPFGRKDSWISILQRSPPVQLGPDPEPEDRIVREKLESIWRNGLQAKMALFALALNAFNLIRFADGVYGSGGGAILFPFLLIMVAVMQPLVYLELLLGQVYLRNKNMNGMTEKNLFSFASNGLRYGTILIGLLFIPNQLVTMNFGSLYSSQVLLGGKPSPCTCRETLHFQIPTANNCFLQPEIFDGPAIPQLVLSDYETCQPVIATLAPSPNWLLVLPSFVGMVFVVLITLRPIPSVPVKLLLWLSPSVFLSGILYLGYQLTWLIGTKEGIYNLLTADLGLDALWNYKIWADAIKLAFISSGVGFGILPLLAASNPPYFQVLYRTSWNYIGLVCLSCCLGVFCAFAEIGRLGDVLGVVDLRGIFVKTNNLIFVAFCSIGCTRTVAFRALAFVFFAVLLFLSSCWPKIILCEGLLKNKTKTIQRLPYVILAPILILLLESVYIHPDAEYMLRDTNWFGGAWPSCGLTVIRVVAFISAFQFNFDRLQLHVEQPGYQTIPHFFLIQLKYALFPLTVAMLVLLTVGMNCQARPTSLDPEYPDWVRYYGMSLNVLPVIVLIVFSIISLKLETQEASNEVTLPPREAYRPQCKMCKARNDVENANESVGPSTSRTSVKRTAACPEDTSAILPKRGRTMRAHSLNRTPDRVRLGQRSRRSASLKSQLQEHQIKNCHETLDFVHGGGLLAWNKLKIQKSVSAPWLSDSIIV